MGGVFNKGKLLVIEMLNELIMCDKHKYRAGAREIAL
jgi:hypothetical protein